MMAADKTGQKQARRAKADSKAVTAPYEPSREERAALEAVRERRRARSSAPRFKVEKKGKTTPTQVVIDHPDPKIGGTLLMEALGTTSPEFADALVNQLGNAGINGQAENADGLNFMLAVVHGIEPKDQIEAMLAAQMAAVHMATMTFARRLNHVENIPQQDSAERPSTSWRGPSRRRWKRSNVIGPAVSKRSPSNM
jgi:hypothetical protein